MKYYSLLKYSLLLLGLSSSVQKLQFCLSEAVLTVSASCLVAKRHTPALKLMQSKTRPKQGISSRLTEKQTRSIRQSYVLNRHLCSPNGEPVEIR